MNPTKKHVFIALAIAFLARLATYPLSEIEHPAFFEYGLIASNIVAGNGYSTIHWIADTSVVVPSAWMPPGQPLITAGFFDLFGETSTAYHLIFLFNALLGTSAVYVLGKCTGVITGNNTIELVALYCAALFPPFISASSTWGIASSVLLLNAIMVYRALRLSQALSQGVNRMRESIHFGISAGVLVLFRAEAPLSIALVLLGLLIYHRHRFIDRVKYLIVSGLLTLAILSPWLIHNHTRFDTLILGSTSGGYNLWRGNNPIATGGGWSYDGATVLPDRQLQAEIWSKIGSVPPVEFERAFSAELADRAKSWMRENPGQAFMLSLKKAVLIWILDLYHPSYLRYVYGFFQLLAIGLAVYAMMHLRKRGMSPELRQWLWVAGGACLATTLLTMVFFSMPRYQIFLVGLYFPLVPIGIHALLQKWGLVRDSSELTAQAQN